MDRTINASVDASPTATMTALADLETYPHWLGLVSAVEAVDGDAWMVTLKARLGPLARSKRLRMVRSERTDSQVQFTRAELDDRDHADWVLTAGIQDTSTNGCDVQVHLHYGGALWSAPLEIVLASFEGSAADRLSAYLARTADDG